jgi:hypothetical protein
MKKLFLLILVLPFAINLKAQVAEKIAIPVDTVRHQIIYAGIVQVPGQSKAEIFACAKQWIQRNFQTHQGFISYEDVNAGRIIIRSTIFGQHSNGIITLPFGFACNTYIWIKDGKYKYEICDFVITKGITEDFLPDSYSADIYVSEPKFKTRKGEYTNRTQEILNIIDGNAQNIIVTLKYAITTKQYPRKVAEDDF